MPPNGASSSGLICAPGEVYAISKVRLFSSSLAVHTQISTSLDRSKRVYRSGFLQMANTKRNSVVRGTKGLPFFCLPNYRRPELAAVFAKLGKRSTV